MEEALGGAWMDGVGRWIGQLALCEFAFGLECFGGLRIRGVPGFGKSQNSEVLVARTSKNYENRILSWPEHVKNLEIPKFWRPEHEETMKIVSSGRQNI